MKNMILLLLTAGIFIFIAMDQPAGLIPLQDDPAVINKPISKSQNNSHSNSKIESAFKNHRSNIQVQDSGTVIRLLSDDKDGSRHQKFIIRLSNGQTLLMAHNIDLAPRINALQKGDTVRFNGEYEWNAKGGVVHWTHSDPAGHHEAGWLKHKGRTYQ